MRIITKGAVDQSVTLYIVDNTTGLPVTSLAFNSSGIDLWYRREGAAVTSITEATQTASGAHSDGGFVHLSNGVYRLDLPDAAVASGVDSVVVGGTVTGYTVYPVTIQLVAVNLQDAVRGGMTALPNANAEAAGGLITRGTGTGQLTVSSGTVTVGTNSDKTGYALTQTFPTNFAALAITGGGAVTAGTVSDKTGYSLSQSFPTNFAALAITAGGAVTVGTNNDKTGYALSQAFPANFAALGINASGHVSRVTLADTLTTYTGNTPQTGDSFARLGAPSLASVSADIGAVGSTLGTVATSAASAATSGSAVQTIVGSGTHGNAALKTLIDGKPTATQLLSTAVPASNTAGTVGDCLNLARAMAGGKWVLDANTNLLRIYAPDGTTVVATLLIGPDLTAPLTRTPQ